MFGKVIDILMIAESYHVPFHSDNSIINTRNIDTVPPENLSLHAHSYYHFYYISDCDSFESTINDCKLTFKPRTLYVFPPNTLHSPANHYSGYVAGISIMLNINDAELRNKLGSIPFSINANEELLLMFRSIVNTLKYPDIELQKILDEKVLKLIHRILTERRYEIVNENPQYDLYFMNVLHYMYANCDRELSLDELANVAHMHRTAFARKFKDIYKITPINYLYSIRLSRSLDLLMSPKLTIAKIAKRVGFKRATAFSTAFVRAFGMSPTEYREILETKKFQLSHKEFKI